MKTTKESIEYGIYRVHTKSLFFEVQVVRRRRIIHRIFTDLLHGGEDEALAAARVYRDAVMRVFPPFTTREFSTKIRSTNTSGVPGVYLRRHKGKALGWIAGIKICGVHRRQEFRFSEYSSEQEAFDAAVLMREQWLAELDSGFFVHDPLAKDVANQTFSALFDRITIDDSTKQGFKDKLAAVNALFDAHYPRYLFVILRIKDFLSPNTPQSLVLRISSYGTKKREYTLSLLKYSLPESLATMRNKAVRVLNKVYSPEVRDAFMAEHGSIFDENVFDPEQRTCIRFLLTTPRGELVISPDTTAS